MFNLIAFLMQSGYDIVCMTWKAAWAKLGTCYCLPDHLKFLTSFTVHQDWDEIISSSELSSRSP